MSNLTNTPNPFTFLDLDVRTATSDKGDPWFCAKDVSIALDITWSGATLQDMPEEWQGMLKLNTPSAENGTGGGEQNTTFISESGLFHLVLRSNKPKARQFSNWICETVLPEIRRTGSFTRLDIKDHINLSKQIESLTGSIVGTNNAYRRKLLLDQLRKLCNIANQPLPPTDWIALNHDQVDIFALEANHG